jgi:hypothetical protein
VFDGWAPREVHKHYDAKGKLTGTTVVTREPMWNDDDRSRALALDEYDRAKCPCGCGQTIEEASDPTRAFVIEDYTCHAGRALKRHERAVADRAEKTNKPEGWSDGLTHYISRSFIPELRQRGGSAS